jgi:hypothetical protein
MLVSRVDKGFLQCDWLRAKVYSLDLHTLGQQPKDNALQNAYMATLFVVPKICSIEERLFTIFMKTQTLLEQTNFSFHSLYILMDFYLVFSREVCLRSFQPVFFLLATKLLL